MLTFSVILEHWQTHQPMFATIEDCRDMADLIDHCRVEFSDYDIQQIREVK